MCIRDRNGTTPGTKLPENAVIPYVLSFYRRDQFYSAMMPPWRKEVQYLNTVANFLESGRTRRIETLFPLKLKELFDSDKLKQRAADGDYLLRNGETYPLNLTNAPRNIHRERLEKQDAAALAAATAEIDKIDAEKEQLLDKLVREEYAKSIAK